MCKEDVRIKRQTATRTVLIAPTNGTFTLAFPPNPMRVAVTFGLSNGSITGGSTVISLRNGDQLTSGVVCAISSVRLFDYATIENLGQLVTGGLWVFTNDIGVPNIAVTEVFFTQDMKDL